MKHGAAMICFMIAGILTTLLVLTSLFSRESGDQWRDATTNISIMHWISTLVIGGLLLRSR